MAEGADFAIDGNDKEGYTISCKDKRRTIPFNKCVRRLERKRIEPFNVDEDENNSGLVIKSKSNEVFIPPGVNISLNQGSKIKKSRPLVIYGPKVKNSIKGLKKSMIFGGDEKIFVISDREKKRLLKEDPTGCKLALSTYPEKLVNSVCLHSASFPKKKKEKLCAIHLSLIKKFNAQENLRNTCEFFFENTKIRLLDSDRSVFYDRKSRGGIDKIHNACMALKNMPKDQLQREGSYCEQLKKITRDLLRPCRKSPRKIEGALRDIAYRLEDKRSGSELLDPVDSMAKKLNDLSKAASSSSSLKGITVVNLLSTDRNRKDRPFQICCVKKNEDDCRESIKEKEYLIRDILDEKEAHGDNHLFQKICKAYKNYYLAADYTSELSNYIKNDIIGNSKTKKDVKKKIDFWMKVLRSEGIAGDIPTYLTIRSVLFDGGMRGAYRRTHKKPMKDTHPMWYREYDEKVVKSKKLPTMDSIISMKQMHKNFVPEPVVIGKIITYKNESGNISGLSGDLSKLNKNRGELVEEKRSTEEIDQQISEKEKELSKEWKDWINKKEEFEVYPSEAMNQNVSFDMISSSKFNYKNLKEKLSELVPAE